MRGIIIRKFDKKTRKKANKNKQRHKKISRNPKTKTLQVTILIIIGIVLGLTLILTTFLIITTQESIWLMIQKHYKADTSITTSVHEYLQGKNSFEELPQTLTINEKQHLKDVRDIFKIFKLVVLVSLTIVLFLTIILFKTLKELIKLLVIASLTCFVILLLLVMALFYFNKSFEVFHKTLFKQNYIFPQHSALIKAFPESFFKAILKIGLALTSLVGIILLLITRFFKARSIAFYGV